MMNRMKEPERSNFMTDKMVEPDKELSQHQRCKDLNISGPGYGGIEKEKTQMLVKQSTKKPDNREKDQ